MRRVRRKHTVKPAPARIWPTSHDFPDVDRDVRTLTKRFAALRPGDSLYPWARTHLEIRNGKRKWVANTDSTE